MNFFIEAVDWAADWNSPVQWASLVKWAEFHLMIKQEETTCFNGFNKCHVFLFRFLQKRQKNQRWFDLYQCMLCSTLLFLICYLCLSATSEKINFVQPSSDQI